MERDAMKQYVVMNGYQTSEGRPVHWTVRASSSVEAIELAQQIFTWQRKRFALFDEFDENLTAFCIEGEEQR